MESIIPANLIFPLFFTALLLSGCIEKEMTREVIESDIQERFEQAEGNFALAFKSLNDTTRQIMINADEMFHAASTMKVPVMIELFQQAEVGQFNLDDSLLVKNEFRSIVDSSRYSMEIDEDSESELYESIGQKQTIRNLIEAMITRSSNLATNLLIEKVGANNVTRTMRRLGADSIRVLRGVEDIKAYRRGLSNRTTARDLMIVFEKLGRGEAVTPKASREMLQILEQQEFNDMIPAGVPDSAIVAHKTGWITGVHHDSGLVRLADGRQYVLVILSKEAPDRKATVKMFARISELIYEFVAST